MNVSRIALVGGVAASTVLLLAGTASAHVSVQPQGEAAKGGYAVINFKVPNERDNASTTKLEVNFPTDHPLASVMPQPVPGWDIKVTKSKLAKPLEMHGKTIDEAVSKVTWTGGKIEPGRFQQFPLSVGQLPEDADQLVFKAIQTYSNKEVVRWIEEPKEGADEPETPAPVLKLTAAADDAHGAAGADAKPSDAAEKSGETTAASASSSDSEDNTARVLGIVGIVIGVAGVAFGVLAGRRRTA
ncbi:YcnI family copper-binding membrane protein [Streptomyces drozdowiczii]|uniref:YcnI family protein n=1 Tax=Streptomyces drozdowiczii TaxID=202862 RepID=A0ABY6PST5_9ACTN|nr:YcnI family protein [Streptomyces drozdowiczii]MCX0244949.1 YcnI family protein [Streptomyces drozdowiczii]UZK55342.1 YcnI family protein [Streptomyces drozdowiczii]